MMREPISTVSPFRWKGHFYSVLEFEEVNGEPQVVVDPPNADLVEEMKRRLFPRPGRSKLYQAFGYFCFQEDYDGN